MITPGPWKWEGDSFEDVEPEVCPHSTDWTDHGPRLVSETATVRSQFSDDEYPQSVIDSSGHDASWLTIKSADAAAIELVPDMIEALQAHAGSGSRSTEAWMARAILLKLKEAGALE